MAEAPAPLFEVDGLEIELRFRDGRRVKAIDGVSLLVGEGEAGTRGDAGDAAATVGAAMGAAATGASAGRVGGATAPFISSTDTS